MKIHKLFVSLKNCVRVDSKCCVKVTRENHMIVIKLPEELCDLFQKFIDSNFNESDACDIKSQISISPPVSTNT